MQEKYEQGRQAIEKLASEFNLSETSTFNEATTRLRYIDAILFSVLGWEQDDILPEHYLEGDYADYIVSLFRPVAVWEAKRIGNYFQLPLGFNKAIYSLKTLIKDNPDLKAAIKQVSGYCHDRGIEVGVVSNGWQLVAFIATRNDSVPPLEGNALVIDSLDAFKENFMEVWNCLSRPGLETRYLIKKLLGSAEIKLPPKLSSTVYDYPGVKNRNDYQTELEILSDLVLEDVIKDKEIEKEFLTECYCKSGTLSSYSLLSKEILTTRYLHMFEANDRQATLEQVATKKGISPELVDLFAHSLSQRPILLIGDVGVGKSTFIDNLLLVEAPKVFERSITFKIDLGSQAILTLDIRRAVLGILQSQLRDNYGIDIEEDGFVRNCYYLELEGYKRNVRVKVLYDTNKLLAIEKEVEFLSNLVDKEETHIKKALEFICKSHKKQIVVFIDNCDQRNDADQETAFLIAQEFATQWPVIVFICLRPETYHRTKRSSGALSGYHTKAFTIAPPRIDEVLQKRLDFALKITSGTVKLSRLNSQIRFSKLHTLITAFKRSLNENDNLYRFIENVSNGNVRKSIELIKKFFGSGHVNTKKIIQIEEESGHYTIPVHEMFNAVVYGDNAYYNPATSEIVNLFDVRTYDKKEHFLVPIILGLLVDYSKNSRNHGFITVSELYSYLQTLGYIPIQIDLALNYMYSKNLFETSQKGNKLNVETAELMIRITSLGAYHISQIINKFKYIDAILIDVPLFDEEVKKWVQYGPNVLDHMTGVSLFRGYLDKIWKENGFKDTHFNWPQKSIELGEDMKEIDTKFRRHN